MKSLKKCAVTLAAATHADAGDRQRALHAMGKQLPTGAEVQELGHGWQRVAFNAHTYLRHYWVNPDGTYSETMVPMEVVSPFKTS